MADTPTPPQTTAPPAFSGVAVVMQGDDGAVHLSFAYPADAIAAAQAVGEFAFPDAHSPAAGVFCFVLTGKSGAKSYGYVARTQSAMGVTTAAVVMSRFPLYKAGRSAARAVARAVEDGTDLEALAAALLDAPVPGPGERATVSVGQGGRQKVVLSRPKAGNPVWPLGFLLDRLPVDDVVTVFAALLYERRVLVLGADISHVTAAVLAFVELIRPFGWQNILVPLLPKSMISHAAAPMPYVMGIPRAYADALNDLHIEDVTVVHLDKGTVSQHQDGVNKLPNKPTAALRSALRAAVARAKKAGTNARGAEIALACSDFMRDIFAGYKSCLRPNPVPGTGTPYVFDLSVLLTHWAASASTVAFLTAFSETQMYATWSAAVARDFGRGRRNPEALLEAERTAVKASNVQRFQSLTTKLSGRVKSRLSSMGIIESKEDRFLASAHAPTAEHRMSVSMLTFGQLHAFFAAPAAVAVTDPRAVWETVTQSADDRTAYLLERQASGSGAGAVGLASSTPSSSSSSCEDDDGGRWDAPTRIVSDLLDLGSVAWPAGNPSPASPFDTDLDFFGGGASAASLVSDDLDFFGGGSGGGTSPFGPGSPFDSGSPFGNGGGPQPAVAPDDVFGASPWDTVGAAGQAANPSPSVGNDLASLLTATPAAMASPTWSGTDPFANGSDAANASFDSGPLSPSGPAAMMPAAMPPLSPTPMARSTALTSAAPTAGPIDPFASLLSGTAQGAAFVSPAPPASAGTAMSTTKAASAKTSAAGQRRAAPQAGQPPERNGGGQDASAFDLLALLDPLKSGGSVADNGGGAGGAGGSNGGGSGDLIQW